MHLDDAVRKILKLGGERVKFVILFGSRARGEARKDSDHGGDEREAFKFRILMLDHLPDNHDVQVFQFLPVQLKKECVRGRFSPVVTRHSSTTLSIKFMEWENFKRYYYDYSGLGAIEWESG